MSTFRRALAVILLATPTVVAQHQPSAAEARVLELTNLLRLGRRDSLEAFIRRSFTAQNISASEMALFLNYYQGFFHLAQGAKISPRDVTAYSASAATQHSPRRNDPTPRSPARSASE
jgi:hypothetical protein